MYLAVSMGLSSGLATPGSVSLRAEPFSTNSTGWTWMAVEGSQCINGKETGVYLRSSSEASPTKLAIYLNGGGACFNTITCATCATTAQPGKPGSGGIFDSTDARNPFKDYNWINVPYCTGDVHTGSIVHTVWCADTRYDVCSCLPMPDHT